MSADDPTLPGRPTRTRRASLSTRSLRVVREVAPMLAAAFALPDGPERDAQLEAAIGHAIDEKGEPIVRDGRPVLRERISAEPLPVIEPEILP